MLLTDCRVHSSLGRGSMVECRSGTVHAFRVSRSRLRGEDAFWPRNRVFWLLLDSEWLSAGDPWQSRIDPERADRVVLPVAYGNAALSARLDSSIGEL